MDAPPAEVAASELCAKEEEPGGPSAALFAFKPLLDVDCLLCFEVLLEPVVGACGHEFCKACLHKHLYKEHKTTCPVAKCSEFLYGKQLAVSQKLQAAVALVAADRVAARRARAVREEEERQQAEAVAEVQRKQRAAEAGFRGRWRQELADHKRKLRKDQEWAQAEQLEAQICALPPGLLRDQFPKLLQQEESRWICYQASWPEQRLAAGVARAAVAAVLSAVGEEEAATEAEVRALAAGVARAAVAAVLSAEAEAEVGALAAAVAMAAVEAVLSAVGEEEAAAEAEVRALAAGVARAAVAAVLSAVGEEEAAGGAGPVGEGGSASSCAIGALTHTFSFPLLAPPSAGSSPSFAIGPAPTTGGDS